MRHFTPDCQEFPEGSRSTPKRLLARRVSWGLASSLKNHSRAVRPGWSAGPHHNLAAIKKSGYSDDDFHQTSASPIRKHRGAGRLSDQSLLRLSPGCSQIYAESDRCPQTMHGKQCRRLEHYLSGSGCHAQEPRGGYLHPGHPSID